MRRLALATAFAAAMIVQPALAGTAAEDRAEFKGYVDTCVSMHGNSDKLVAQCVEDQVSSLESYLGDILVETEGIVGEAHLTALHRAQRAWEDYRNASCGYQAALAPRDALRRGLFCRLRLVRQRIEEIRGGEGFADPEAKD